MLKIRLKYCGGCNPEIDREEVAGQVERLIRDRGLDAVFTASDEQVHLKLLLNGCPQACLEEDPATFSDKVPFISVQGARLDYRPVPEKSLARAVLAKIEAFINVSNPRQKGD